MADKPLYQDENLKIDNFSLSPEDHIIYIKQDEDREVGYIIGRGILRELAEERDIGDLMGKIDNINFNIRFAIRERRVGIKSLHTAFQQAYAEEGRLIHDYIEQNR